MATTQNNKLAEALLAAQQEMPSVPKTGHGEVKKDGRVQYTYDYMTLDDLIAAVKPVLNKHGLYFTQAPVYIEGYGPGLNTTITHISGEAITATMPLVLDRQHMQALGGAITYARRYQLGAMVGIATDEDDDAASASGEAANTRSRPSALAEDSTPDGKVAAKQRIVKALGLTGTKEELAAKVEAFAKSQNITFKDDAETMGEIAVAAEMLADNYDPEYDESGIPDEVAADLTAAFN